MKKNQEKKQKIVLLDAHAIIHRAYHGMPDFATRAGVPTGAIYGFASMVLKIIEEFKPDHIIACYDLPGKTFRHESFADYKGGRAKTDEALKSQFEPTREICAAFSIPMYDAPGFEADDILGTIAEQTKERDDLEIIIASGDMDTLQLVDKKRVQVYTLKRGDDAVIYDERAVVDRFGFKPLSIIDYKALRGDPSDNIPGIKGIGEKAATIAISEFGTIEKMYKALDKKDAETNFVNLGLTKRMIGLIRDGKEEAEFSKIIATIRLDVPMDFTVPQHSWNDAVDMEHALEIFDKYELRALPARLRRTLGMKAEIVAVSDELVDDAELHRTSIALCLLDSDKTDAQLEDILEYNKDVSFQAAKRNIFDELSKIEKPQQVFDNIEEPLIQVIKTMQDNGILIDQDFFVKLSTDYHKTLSELETSIHASAGTEFNIKSPKQLSKVLFEDMALSTKGIKKSKTGAYSTNVSTLEKLHDEHEIIQKIMEYRELEKLLSTYIDVIPNLVDDDAKLHAQFIQNGTVTGRFSSRNPNMQNIPTRSDLGRKIREGFISEPGTQLISFDYSQVELRVLAILSDDEALIEIFTQGRDIHTAVAALIGGVSESDVDREMRRKAKVVNFGILYGMGINSLRREMGTDKEEAQKFYHGFFTQFPRATAFLESTKEFASEHGYTETLFGRRRQFKNINSKMGFIKAMAERMALNAPIQGTSADMIKLAMVEVDKWISEKNNQQNIKLSLQIHDEVIYQVSNDLIDEFNTVAMEIMSSVLENSYLKYESKVPFLVHSSRGLHWGELK